MIRNMIAPVPQWVQLIFPIPYIIIHLCDFVSFSAIICPKEPYILWTYLLTNGKEQRPCSKSYNQDKNPRTQKHSVIYILSPCNKTLLIVTFKNIYKNGQFDQKRTNEPMKYRNIKSIEMLFFLTSHPQSRLV